MPPLDVLISIANVLNVSLDYLAGLDNVEKYAIKDLSLRQRELLEMLFAETLLFTLSASIFCVRLRRIQVSFRREPRSYIANVSRVFSPFYHGIV